MYQPYPVEGPKNILVLTRKQSNFLLELSVLKGAAWFSLGGIGILAYLFEAD